MANPMTLAEDTGAPPRSITRGVGFVYVIAWVVDADEWIVKVGETWMPSRWRAFVGRGGKLLALFRGPANTALTMETSLHSIIAKSGRPAFSTRDEARALIGPLGGWTECYRLHPDAVYLILKGITPHAVVQN